MSGTEELAERMITVALRKAKATPKYRRTDRTVNVLKGAVARHMKVEPEEVKLSPKLNEYIWSRGRRSTLPRISVKVTKDPEGVVYVRLPEEKEEGEETKAKEARKEEVKPGEAAADEVAETKPEDEKIIRAG